MEDKMPERYQQPKSRAFHSNLHPLPEAYETISITHPDTKARLKVAVDGTTEDLLPVDKLLDGAYGAHLAAAIWNGGLRSRQDDGDGYVKITISPENVVIEAVTRNAARNPRFVVNLKTATLEKTPVYNRI